MKKIISFLKFWWNDILSVKFQGYVIGAYSTLLITSFPNDSFWFGLLGVAIIVKGSLYCAEFNKISKDLNK